MQDNPLSQSLKAVGGWPLLWQLVVAMMAVTTFVGLIANIWLLQVEARLFSEKTDREHEAPRYFRWVGGKPTVEPCH